MSTATLTFTLPEEREEFEIASKAVEYSIVLSELDAYLRARIKYEELPEPVVTALQAARDRLWEEAQARGIQL
jgi:hypothetical protein